MGHGARASELAEIPAAKELTERALRRLLRGGTSEALAREMAWAAVRSTGTDAPCLDWLADALEVRLADHVNRLEALVKGAGASAKAEYLQRWADDLIGAEAAASCAGQNEAEQALSRLYVECSIGHAISSATAFTSSASFVDFAVSGQQGRPQRG